MIFFHRKGLIISIKNFPGFQISSSLYKVYKLENSFLTLVFTQFIQYKKLGDKTIKQLNDEMLHWQYNEQSLSIATIIKHLHGNMLSRLTDFLTTDGEKEWRKRDAEFVADESTKDTILAAWEEGWACVINTLSALDEKDLTKTVFIRSEPHTVMAAITRQLTHYAYHVGQIISVGKMCMGENWTTLSISPGKSAEFNKQIFSRGKI